MHALPRSQLERLEISKKRPHPASPTGSTSTPSYPNYWDAALPAPATSFLPTLPPISYLTRDAIVRMAYLTLSHLAGLCQFVDGVDPECLQNSQLEIALGIVSRFTHNLDVARPTPNSPRNKVCTPYDQLPTTPRRKYQRTSSNPSLLRTSSKNNLLNSNNAVRTAPQINQPTVNTTPTDQTYTNQTTITYNQHSTNPYNNTTYADNVYNAYNSPFSEAGASSLSPAPVKEERGGDVSSPPSEVFFARAPAQGGMNQCNNQGGREASYPREEMEEASTSEILSEIMATWGVKDEEKEAGSVGGSGTVKKGIRVKAAEGEITILPFRMPSITLQRTVTPPPIVFSQFYPPQTLSLDSFEIGATLGTGTYGIVKLCKQKSTQNFFALKIINKERIARLQQRRHIINEKKILMQLNHPFIVKLYTTFQDPVNIYFLMEFVPGGELFSHIRRNARGYLSNSAACFYAAEIVLAIRYLHFLKIAHRDLKPENILLDESGHAKIVDFGFAKKISEKAWTMCGTPHYIAPEIILGKGHTHAVDYWSLGIMIYEMLSGNPPFAGSNKLEVFKKIVSNEPIEMPDHFQPLAKDLIKRLLMTDYTHRLGYGGVEEVMRHPWFQNIDWDALYHCSMQPPVHLPLAGEGDTSLFPQYPIEGENLDYLFEESISEGSARPDNFWKGF